MSTKIYSGFRFTTNSWSVAHKHIMAFRAELKGLVNKERARQIAEYACLEIDRRAIGFHDCDSRSAYVKAIKKNWDEEKVFPVAFTIAVFPYGRRIYGMTFGWPAYQNLWESKPFVEAWGYWNNTDRPEDVTAAEWRHRRDTWDKIVGYNSPSMTGFTADCISSYETHVSAEDLAKYSPKFESRVRIVAADKMFVAYKRYSNKEGVDAFTSFQTWVRGEGSKKFQAECETIRPQLAKRITKKMIMDGEATR